MLHGVLDKAKLCAYRLLNYRPRSEQEIRDKLRKKGFAKSAIDCLVADFKDRFLIDDCNFAQLWARSRLQISGKSFSSVRRELTVKGIATDIIENVMSKLEIEFSEYDTAKTLIKNRLRSVYSLKPDKARYRLYYYLKRRGFPDSIVCKVIDETYTDTK